MLGPNKIIIKSKICPLNALKQRLTHRITVNTTGCARGWDAFEAVCEGVGSCTSGWVGAEGCGASTDGTRSCCRASGPVPVVGQMPKVVGRAPTGPGPAVGQTLRVVGRVTTNLGPAVGVGIKGC
jgi:hypothetical protein